MARQPWTSRAARKRLSLALVHIEEALAALNAASVALSKVSGLTPEWSVLCLMVERVSLYLDRLRSKAIDNRLTAPEDAA